ncbi:hypothetical protein CEO98_23915, partial [Klebsiella pneumoniae]
FIHGLWSGSPPDTRGRSPVRKSRTPGSVRGVSGNGYPYRDIYQRADHASTVRHRRGFPRVGIAQFQGVPVPSHPRLR